jgi:hypothetical protein
MDIYVHCPMFQLELASATLSGVLGQFVDNSPASVASALLRSKSPHIRRLRNAPFTDHAGQQLNCNERPQGVHLVSPFQKVPWVHRLLNFWAGANVWGALESEHRDLSTA